MNSKWNILALVAAPIWAPILFLYVGVLVGASAVGDVVSEIWDDVQLTRKRRAHPEWFVR